MMQKVHSKNLLTLRKLFVILLIDQLVVQPLYLLTH